MARIDLAVHSSKDMPTVLPDGLMLAPVCRARMCAMPLSAARRRRSPTCPGRRGRHRLAAPAGDGQAPAARFPGGTFRGNVETRLKKLDEGVVDATLLAVAGLKRLGRARRRDAVLEVDDFFPAVGQGAIGIETRADDAAPANSSPRSAMPTR